MKKTILLWLWICTAAGKPLQDAIQQRSDLPGIYASEYTKGYRPYAYVAVPLHEPVPVLHVLSPTPLHRPSRGVTRHHSWTHDRPSEQPDASSDRPDYYPGPHRQRVYGTTEHPDHYSSPSRPPVYRSPNNPDSYSSPNHVIVYASPNHPSVYASSEVVDVYVSPNPDDYPSNRPRIYVPPSHPGVYASSMPHARYTPPAPVRPIHQQVVETAPPPEIIYARPKPEGGFKYSRKPYKHRKAPVQPEEPYTIKIHKYRLVKDR